MYINFERINIYVSTLAFCLFVGWFVVDLRMLTSCHYIYITPWKTSEEINLISNLVKESPNCI